MNACYPIAIAVGCLTTAVHAGSPAVSAAFTARVAYDTNAFLQDAPPGQAAAALPAREAVTMADTALMVGAGWKTGSEFAFEGTCTTEVVRYLGHPSEDHVDHVFGVTAARTRGNWAADFKARYAYTNGSREAPVYTCAGGGPAIGGEPVRARREQEVGRASGSLTHHFAGPRFVRGVFAWLDQDFHTRQRSMPGYTNYTDRGEWSAGADTGSDMGKNLALVTGFRAGRQHQADILGVPLNYTNTFSRWLAGIEGNPAPKVKIAMLAGPDIRHYGHSVRPDFASTQHATYAEASLAWLPTPADAVTFGFKRYTWLSSGGRGAYLDHLVDLSGTRKLGPAWSLGSGVGFHTGDSAGYNPSTPRRDRIYTTTLGISRRLGRSSRIAARVLHDWANSLVPNTPGREYSRWIGSLEVAGHW